MVEAERAKKSNRRCRGRLNTAKGSSRKIKNNVLVNIFEQNSYFHIHLCLNIWGSVERSTQYLGMAPKRKHFAAES